MTRWQSAIFQMNFWKNPDKLCYVEVWVEKDAIATLISEVAKGYQILTCPTRGICFHQEQAQGIRVGDEESFPLP